MEGDAIVVSTLVHSDEWEMILTVGFLDFFFPLFLFFGAYFFFFLLFEGSSMSHLPIRQPSTETHTYTHPGHPLLS